MLLLPFSNFDYDINSIYFLYFALGILIFNIGFFLTSFGKNRTKNTIITNPDLLINNKIISLLIIFELIIILFYSIYLSRYILSNYTYNFFYTLKAGQENTFSLGYFTSFIIAFTAYILIMYFKAKNFKNKKLILIIQITIGSIATFLTLGRTTILLYSILLLIIYAIMRDLSNRIIARHLLLFGIIGLVLFSIYNILKYPYLFENGSIMNLVINGFLQYLSGSLVTFQQWALLDTPYLFGENTFRFINAILDVVGYEVTVQKLTNPFLNISDSVTSNVYTFYHFYAEDFGLIYALIIQFIVGMLYGLLYLKLMGKKLIWIFFYALSIYPLIMQFFQDQYLSLTSTWIQYIILGIILFKTKVFIRK